MYFGFSASYPDCVMFLVCGVVMSAVTREGFFSSLRVEFYRVGVFCKARRSCEKKCNVFSVYICSQ